MRSMSIFSMPVKLLVLKTFVSFACQARDSLCPDSKAFIVLFFASEISSPNVHASATWSTTQGSTSRKFFLVGKYGSRLNYNFVLSSAVLQVLLQSRK